MLLEKEYLNSVCQMHSSTNSMLGTAKISQIGENFIVLTSDKEDLPPFNFLTFIKLTLKHPKAGYKVILGSVSESTPDRTRVSSLVMLTNDERRGYFRLHQVTLTDLYLCQDVALAAAVKGGYLGPNQPHVEKVSGVIKNISLSGILLNSTTYLQIGQRVVVELETKKGIDLFQISIRRRIEDFEVGGYDYGCVIHETNNTKMDDLFRFILEKQALIIQKLKR